MKRARDARVADAVPALRGAAAGELAVYRLAGTISRLFVVLLRACAARGSQRRILLGERLGYWGGPGDRDAEDARAAVWIHAASVGEVLVARPLVAALRARQLGLRVLLTCNTATGRRVAETLAADETRFFPIDDSSVLARVLASARPSLFVFVETEIWPMLLLELASRGIPAAMVNARISDRSFPRYRLVGSLVRAALSRVAVVCARDRVSYERLLALGVSQQRAIVAGDLKLDALDAGEIERTPDLLARVDAGAAVLLAASTHEGEDEVVLAAFRRVRERHGAARLVIAPRHPERAATVEALAVQAGFATSRWTRCSRDTAWDVLVVDTTGELRGFMPAAAGAFVGGSLVDAGGHNVLEPAAYALPTAVGPHLGNVREQAEAMTDADCLRLVRDAGDLGALWTDWLDDRAGARDLGRRARAFVEAHGGALARTLEALAPWLPSGAAAGESAVPDPTSSRRDEGRSGPVR